MLIPILPLFADSFGVSYSLVGLVLASQGIGTLIGDVPAGLMEGRLGQRRAMLLGIATIAISILAMSWAQSVLELIVYGLGSGLGTALFNISRVAYITNATAIQRRGRAIAIFGGLNRIGTFGGPVVGGAIGLWLGLRAPFILYALVAVVGLALVAIFARNTGEISAAARGGVRSHSSHLWDIIKAHHRNLASAGSGMLMAQMIRAGRQIIIPLYGAEVLGLDVQQIGLIISMAAAIDMCMFYPAGIIMDRYGRKFAYVPSFLIQALGMALIPLTAGFTGLVFATLIIGFGNGLGSGTMMTLGADLSPPESVGEFLGVWRLIGDTGQSAAPIIVGSVADVVGFAIATWVIASAGLAAASILGLAVPETLKPSSKAKELPAS
jgi:MFS family permease